MAKTFSDLLKELKENNSISHFEDQHGNNLLHYVVSIGDLESCRLLLKNGFEVDKTNKQGRTPLHYAFSKKNQEEIVKYLLAYGAKVDKEDKTGITPLHCAIKYDYSNLFKLLLSHSQKDINQPDENGETLMHPAAFFRSEEHTSELQSLTNLV